MIARIPALVALLALGLGSTGIAADSGKDAFAPKAYSADRYAAIWKRSPFIVETVAVQQSAGLATKYSLVGIAQMNNEPVVFLQDNNASDPARGRILVSKTHPSPSQISLGIELVSLVIDRDPGNSSAVIRKGGEQATLSYAASQLASAGKAAGAPAAPRPGIPAPNMPGGVPRPPGIPVPPPSAAVPNNTSGAPPPTRRIIRPAINNAP
jgi:hypothetical protein